MPNRRGSRIPIERAARFRLGSIEFKLAGISRFDLRDPYHLAVGLTWPQFVAALFALYLSLNVVFATLFWLAPGSVTNARPGSFLDVFFFSIETLATVGYGEMYPATLYGHVVVAIEIVCGFAFTAIVTGLTFVRFSRPRAKLIFATNPVVATYNGKPTLMGAGRQRPRQRAHRRGGEAEHFPLRNHCRGQAAAPRARAPARAGAHSGLPGVLDTYACARRAQPAAWL